MVERIGTQSAPLQRLQPQQPVRRQPSELATRFGEQLVEARDLVSKAESAAASMATGETGSVETILALSRAELAMRHVVSVRNRILESYREVMSLPL